MVTFGPPPSARVVVLTLTLAVALAARLASAADSCAGRPLFIFGDSEYEVGQNNYMDPPTDLTSNFPPYGLHGTPATGRFSDGKNIPDLLAEALGVPYPPPFMAKSTELRQGINFASAGAGVLNTTCYQRSYPMWEQLDMFRSVVDLYSKEDLNNAVFLMNFGFNDHYFCSNFPHLRRLCIRNIVYLYTNFMKALFNIGARNFLYVNLGPAGCLPYFRAFGITEPPYGCYNKRNDVPMRLNRAIEIALQDPNFIFAQRTGGVKLVTFDKFGFAMNIIGHLEKFGFETIDACCGAPASINGRVKCGRSLMVEGVKITTTLCNDTSKHMFFDYAHGTEKLFRIEVDAIWNGSPFTLPRAGAKSMFCT